MGRAQDKVVLVTGGGSGIGAAICDALAAEGACVIVSDRTAESAQAVAESLHDDSMALTLDVTVEADWIAAMASIRSCFGRLDALDNNAGVLSFGTVEDVSLEHYRWVNAIMNEGVFLGVKHALPLLRQAPSGSIVNISSTAALRGYEGFVAYSAAKGAVLAMTKAVAVACQDRGDLIRCNSVHPGDIETPMQQAFDNSRAPRPVATGVLPKGAVGAPSDVAAMVLFLVSDEARFITGGEFVVDNGATARAGW